eukprot:TRINITY_DN1292_c0_g1_i4.p2 TRINITY_DN1292_c0_g1~~TRINITY_DN1292_c0_g1_i4.p2  ORF type:complete len:224 (+),score=89.37 TRINITY_DN1292_c0_g1_i4:65-736(+)
MCIRDRWYQRRVHGDTGAMVFYFVSSDGHLIYMGKDKYENETLLKWGWPEDLWFHVDDLSSAHVYLRLKPGETMDTLNETAVEECCQLVKANSIEGSKLDRVKIVYTMFTNLQKRGDMDVGQVGFKSERDRRYRTIEKNREIVKAMMRTKEEKYPDLEAERLRRDAEEKKVRVEAFKKQLKEKEEMERKKKEEDDLRSYKDFMNSGEYNSNREGGKNLEDDFM